MDIGNLINTEKVLMRAVDVAKALGISLETVYDWKYRAKKRRVPAGMFVKIGRMLYVNTVLLREWLSGQTMIY